MEDQPGQIKELDAYSCVSVPLLRWIARSIPLVPVFCSDVASQKADIAVVDLTITYDREQVVDFTIPFMNTGISILFKKPEKSEPAIFSFLYPFSIVVWFYTLTVYTFVSILVYVLGRFTPYEWVPSHPCDPASEPENQFSSLQNAFWFTMGSIMQQGSDLVPRLVARQSRILRGCWIDPVTERTSVELQGHLNSCPSLDLVLLHVDPDFFVYSEPRGFPDSRPDGIPH